MLYSRIAGTGRYLPARILTNADLEKMVDTSDEWIVERTGIRNRHIAGEGDTTASMGEAAARQAIEAAGIDPKQIQLILLATSTPDRLVPSTACLLQQRLGIPGCPAMDISATCSGFIYGLSIADQYIKTGLVDCVLVVASEVMSRVVDWTDRNTCILFSDGAGAAVIKGDERPGIVATHIHADGQYKDLLYIANSIGELEGPSLIKMQGNEVFRCAVNKLGEIVDEALDKNGITREDVDWLLPHQANLRIIQAMAKRLSLPMDRVILTFDEQGNTSAASIPLALDRAVRDGRIKPGELVLMEAFGAGFTWGSALVRF